MHLVCGEALYDIFVDDLEDSPSPVAGEVMLRAIAGGSPYNVPIGMARLGAPVELASDVARDALGDRLVAQLGQEGVGIRFLRRSSVTTPLAIVATDAKGVPSYRFLGLEDAIYCPADEAIEEATDQIRAIHVGSIATVLTNSSRPLRNLVKRFADRALITLDPNVRRSVIPDLVTWHNALDDLRSFAHLIKVSEEDVAALYGDADPVSVCRSWLTDRTALVVLTRGAAGASLFSRAAGCVEVPAADTVVADTVGAGDSFMSALIAQLTQKQLYSTASLASLDPNQLFALGSYSALAASVACSRRGPNLPTAWELETLVTSGEKCS